MLFDSSIRITTGIGVTWKGRRIYERRGELCLNVLHQIANATQLVSGLNELLTESADLYLTSLVSTDRTIGDWYLKALYRTGEFVRPRNELELKELFGFSQRISYVEKGNMAFVTMAKREYQTLVEN